MLLCPKRMKFKKMHKGRNRGMVVDDNISFGEFALRAVSRGRIKSCQIEAARRAISRAVKRQGKIWIRIFPDKPITEKPLEVRMGKGKGNVEYWVALIQPGKILYEINGVSKELACHAFKLGASKLPVQTVFMGMR